MIRTNCTSAVTSALLELATMGLALGLLVVTPGPAGAQGAKPWTAPERRAHRPNPVPATEQTIASGRAIFEHECVPCHGKAGHGDGPNAAGLSKKPADLGSAAVAAQSDGALFWKISEGRGEMPNQSALTEEQRWMIVDYLRTLHSPKAALQ